MADTVSFRVSGIEDLQNRFLALAEDMQKKAASSATLAAAKLVKAKAIQNAPRYEKPHTLNGVVVQPGNLKRNIVAKKVRDDKSLTSQHIVTVRGKAKYGFAARYGRLVEFGTVKMAPEPYLRPALLSEKNRAADAMADKLRERIEKFGR